MDNLGIEIFRPNGSVILDRTNKAGVYVETLTMPGAGEGSKVYPDIPAGCLYFVGLKGSNAHIITVGNDVTGQAKISWAYNPARSASENTVVIIFARRVNNARSLTAAVLNTDGDCLFDLSYPSPQFYGTISPMNSGGEPLLVPSGALLYERYYTNTGLNGGDNRILLMNLPDSTSDDLWYAFDPYATANNNAKVYVYSPRGYGPVIRLPSIHSYALSAPTSSGKIPNLQCFNGSGALTYDAYSENVVIKDTATIVPVGGGGINPGDINTNLVTLNMNFPSVCGVIAPFYRAKYFTDTEIKEYYLSLWQRKGNVLNYQIKLVQGVKGGRQSAIYSESAGGSGGGGVIVADISQVNPAPSIYTF